MSQTPDAKAAAAPENAEGRDYRTVPVEAIRRFAQDETELTSIRHVAEEVGLGRTTLHKFVAGETMPHPRVRRLLALWYLRRHGQQGETSDEQHVRAGLQVLARYLPEEVRDRFMMQAVNAMEAAFMECDTLPPEWIRRLRAGE